MSKTGCPGFSTSGIACGLKKNGGKDLGLIYADAAANVAGVFTRNLVQAAPVLLDRQRIKTGLCRALIVNSGNANCCTGEQGMQAAKRMARSVADSLGVPEDDILVASTGVIGEPLPIEKIEAAVPALIDALEDKDTKNLAQAMMTTDTVPKFISRRGEIDGKVFHITGVAKGSGMIRPDMATMLCFVMTDVRATSEILREVLVASVNRSLNRITVDGDTSTNDTAILMASGACGIEIANSTQRDEFQSVLDDVLTSLAKWLIKDGEGATKLVDITVMGADSTEAAHRIADTVANSNLTKTAFYGEDANWGRILAAAGRAGVAFDPGVVDIRFGSVPMVQNGQGCGPNAEAEATEVLKRPEYDVTIDLKMGNGSATVFTCDFSIDYVKINADYRT
jgi:glutamate N-acetyltransferase/amino-acid N-acetyltransferase